MTVIAKYDGKGFFEDPDAGTKVDGAIPAGEPFEVTKVRFKELKAQGIPLSEVSQVEATKSAPSAKEA